MHSATRWAARFARESPEPGAMDPDRGIGCNDKSLEGDGDKKEGALRLEGPFFAKAAPSKLHSEDESGLPFKE